MIDKVIHHTYLRDTKLRQLDITVDRRWCVSIIRHFYVVSTLFEILENKHNYSLLTNVRSTTSTCEYIQSEYFTTPLDTFKSSVIKRPFQSRQWQPLYYLIPVEHKTCYGETNIHVGFHWTAQQTSDCCTSKVNTYLSTLSDMAQTKKYIHVSVVWKSDTVYGVRGLKTVRK